MRGPPAGNEDLHHLREVLELKVILIGWVVLLFSSPVTGLAITHDDLGVPEGPIILTVTGNIGHTNAGDAAQFDRAMLKALPQHAFVTSTPWTDGTSHYSGPLMRDLLERLNADNTTVRVAALNGYEADIPVSDFADYDVILALEKAEKAIPIREYGPLWVLYPFDQHDELLSEKIRSRAVWQVMDIHVR